MPSQLYAGTLTVDGGGLFLHGVKGKKKPRQLARSGLMSEAVKAFGTDELRPIGDTPVQYRSGVKDKKKPVPA